MLVYLAAIMFFIAIFVVIRKKKPEGKLYKYSVRWIIFIIVFMTALTLLELFMADELPSQFMEIYPVK